MSDISSLMHRTNRLEHGISIEYPLGLFENTSTVCPQSNSFARGFLGITYFRNRCAKLITISVEVVAGFYPIRFKKLSNFLS